MTTSHSEVDLSAQNTFSDWVTVYETKGGYTFLAAISGTWAGTVTVQAKKPGEADSTAVDVDTYTANSVQTGNIGTGGMVVRAGFKTGEYTSGTATVLVKSS